MKKLTSAKDAIEQAIEGGYTLFGSSVFPLFSVECGRHHPFGQGKSDNDEFWRDIWTVTYAKKDGRDIRRGYMEFYDKEILTDPLFWQALGKARGWGNVVNGIGRYKTKEWGNWIPLDSWGWFAHEWFENRMVGGDENKFWESLP